MINYKTLLQKYMEHVGDCEGDDFVDWLNSYHSGRASSTGEYC